MSISLVILCLIFSFTLIFVAVLYVDTGVGGFGWIISARVIRMGVVFWKFSNNPPNYASVADSMEFIMIPMLTVPQLASAVTWSRGPRPWRGFTHGTLTTVKCPLRVRVRPDHEWQRYGEGGHRTGP